MKTLRMIFCALAMMAATSAFAVLPIGFDAANLTAEPAIHSLDEQCTIDFQEFTYGTYSGSMTWPGGDGQYYMTGLIFTNSCTPDNLLYAYCVDLDHTMQHNPYCADIDDAVVKEEFPERYPAMGYIMSWYGVFDALEDRIMQLSLWKLSDDLRSDSPTFEVPFHHINAGRGYPNLADAPIYPYVNTVFNSDPEVNGPANLRVLDALGSSDGMEKNVILDGDQFVLSFDQAIIDGGLATVPVHVQLVRGARALAVGNTLLGGVRLTISVDFGILSDALLFADDLGQVHFTVTQPVGTPYSSNVMVCSHGVWPKTVKPCDGYDSQQFLVQSQTAGAMAILCVPITIPFDHFLAVELTSFEVTATVGGIELTWRTASENEAARWEIQKRESEFGEFETLVTLPARNSSGGAAYRFEDRDIEAGLAYEYRLVDVDVNETRTVHNDMIRSAAALPESLPVEFTLSSNYPNPFNPATVIPFALSEPVHVRLNVYDVMGHKVTTLADGEMPAGEYRVTFDARDLPSGLYFYTLETGRFSQTKRMVLMK